MSSLLADLLVEQLGPGARKELPPPDGLERILAAHLVAGQARWPEVSVDPAAFVAALARGITRPEHLRDLAQLKAEELYLTCACAGGSSKAIALLEEAYFSEVDAALAKMGAGAPPADELKQALRAALFVAKEGARPKIAEYSGRGGLKIWIKVTAARLALKLATRKPPEDAAETSALERLAPANLDPEVQNLRRAHGKQFGEAFAVVLAGLPTRDRTLLRYRFVDGLTLPQMSTALAVHHTTVSRRLAEVRELVSRRVQRELKEQLGLTGAELESLTRFVQGEVDVTVERLLRSQREST